jgi:hypothetical protein
VAGVRFHLEDAGLQDSIFKSMPVWYLPSAQQVTH